jgi:hypothetical protein
MSSSVEGGVYVAVADNADAPDYDPTTSEVDSW